MTERKKSSIRIGDKVQVKTGTYKGVVGIVTSILTKNSHILIDGILPRVKFVKNQQKNESTKIEIPTSIHISNVLPWDEKTNSSSRIGYKFIEDKKVRYFKKSGNLFETIKST